MATSIRALKAVLEDGSNDLAQCEEAAGFLAELKVPEATRALIDVILHHPESEVQGMAEVSLVQHDQPELIAIINEARRSSDYDALGIIMAAMENDGARQLLLDDLDSGEMKTRMKAVYDLRYFEHPDALAGIRRVLNNKEEEEGVRSRAAASLGAFSNEPGVSEELHSILRNPQEESGVRLAALQGCLQVMTPEIQQTIDGLLEDDSLDPFLRQLIQAHLT